MKLLDQSGHFRECLCHLAPDIQPLSIAHRGPEVQVASQSLQQDIGVEEFHQTSLRLESGQIKVLEGFPIILGQVTNPVEVCSLKESTNRVVGITSRPEFNDGLVQDLLGLVYECPRPLANLDDGSMRCP